MKIIFVRHGEPDYANDTLTEKGWREARALAERICKWDVTDFYCSPLGRAKATASCTLDKMNRTAKTLDWMQEFAYFIDDPVTGRHGVPWDFVPSFWSGDPLMKDMDRWVEAEVMQANPQIPAAYQNVCEKLDSLLASYGYVREGCFYRMPDAKERFIVRTIEPGDKKAAKNETENTASKEPVIVIFCHLGITCLAVSHLLNIPFQLLVHGFFLPTTSLTILTTEERWSNEAYFRVQAMGDVHHLLEKGVPVAKAGCFAEVFQG
ncbi:hypothetical protein IMSAGC009_00593 [Lachnospiraceae bacterium]|nr:hypothetical protein IMSAGC009_00593 [Lachnospiraceae bacterium]